jgi:hypothetical protein
MQKRTRGYILTRQGVEKLEAAKREWENQHGARCTQEKMKELTSAYKEDGLYTGTIRKIFKGEKEVDRESIHCLFSAFNLQLDDDDLTSEPQACLPKLDPNFLGRDEAIADLNTFVSQGAKVILIYGKGGVGKTTLAKKYFSTWEFDLVLEPPMAKETKNITPIESVVEELLRDLQGEPAQDFGITLKRLKQQLKTQKVGVLIDNLEPALDKDGKFIEAHRGYVELFSVLADSDVQAVTLVTSRECLNESCVNVKPYELKGMAKDTWQQYFSSRNFDTDSPALSEMHKAYGGNAKAMQILCSTIQEDYEGDLEAYWQENQGYLLIERELEDLVKSQFDRLGKHDTEAYQLLCRLGCYRYQEIPSVPINGVLCLLWNIPEEQHNRVIKSLRYRALVEFNKGRYWLHPVIQSEAVRRLKSNKDWQLVNAKATYFGLENFGEDILKLLQFLYHYKEFSGELTKLAELWPDESEFSGSEQTLKELVEIGSDMANSCYFEGLLLKKLDLIEESNIYFQKAILILNTVGELKQAEEVQQVIENDGEAIEITEVLYKIAECSYNDGLRFKRIEESIGEIEGSKIFFQEAIDLFNFIGAFEEVEEVRRAMVSET